MIGIGCRFAGDIDSPESFWSFLTAGRDAVGDVPAARWEPYQAASPENAAVLRRSTRRGAFLTDIEGFDADFFGITPREAALMDPQQRILLEVTWQALEYAGVPPRDLAGTDTGVFVGVGSDDYGRRLLEDLPRIEAWTGIGGAFCAVANRVSYTLDLRGPSLAVDTACSSSLVALHLACQSLRDGECPVAIAGGVLVMAGPGLTLVLDAAGATAPDGRCKSFDASADGYGRGEGAGVVVLKRLADAVSDGDRVLAVIRGSAVHQDGLTNGIMAPSRPAQEHLLRRTYRAAGLSPDTVDYVEAHGTGTRMGDPIEAGALAAVFGASRPAGRPCLIGSVKPNIGHLEAGAGIAGVIKAVLALNREAIPPTVCHQVPNPDILWDRSGLRVVTQLTPWPRVDHPRRAGVSAFGYGGTIAHVLLEQAPERPAPPSAEPRIAVFPLSAATGTRLPAQADRLAEWLTGPGAAVPLATVGHTLARRRPQLAARAAVVAADRAELVARLRNVSAGDAVAGVATGTVLPATPSGLVWVFSGHGSQWSGMGRELLATEPACADVFETIEPVFREELGFSLHRVIRDGELGGVDRIQPLIFAVQLGLAAAWRAYGVHPAAIMGHSVGEIAAAVTAGVLDVRDGARLVARRSLLLRQVAGRGAMAMVNLPFTEAAEWLAGREDVAPAIAASSTSTVVAGAVLAVAEVSARWRAEGLLVRQVDSDVAFHTGQMDPLVGPLTEAAADLRPAAPRLPLYSTVLDDPRTTAVRDGRYWAANLRKPVRLAQAVTTAAEDGYRLFLEISSHPVLVQSITETLAELGVEDAYVGHSLRRGKPERLTLLTNLGTAYCHGAPVDWSAPYPGRELADVPGTTWLHRPYWAESRPPGAATTGQHDPAGHTLLGGRVMVNGPTPAQLWQTYLDGSCRPYPGDHPVNGVEIIPAAVLLNSFFAAASADGPRPELADVALRVPVGVASPREVQIVHQDGSLRLASRLLDDRAGPEADQAWLTHTTATAVPANGSDPRGGEPLDLAGIRRRCAESLPAGYVTDRLGSVGVAAMGFPWVVEHLCRGEGELLATVRAEADSDEPPGTWAPVLDAALSIASVVFTGPAMLRMPAQIRQVVLGAPPPARALIAVRVVDGPAAADTVHVDVADEAGRPCARFTGLRYGLLDGDPGAPTSPRRLLHDMVWRPFASIAPRSIAPRSGAPRSGAPRSGAPRTVFLVGDEPDRSDPVARRLAAAGVPVRWIGDPEHLAQVRDRLTEDAALLVVPARCRPGEPVAEAGARSAWLLARTAQWLTGPGAGARCRLWAVTTGVRDCVQPESLGQAPVWGLGRVLAGEHPEIWGGVLDLDGGSPPEPSVLLQALAAPPGEDVVAVSGDTALVARLEVVSRPPVGAAFDCRPDGTYLITGGLGVLGLEVARWLAGRGARRLVLAGRRGLVPRESWPEVTDPEVLRQIEAVRGLEALGVTVRTVALDITDREESGKLLSSAHLGLPPVRGVVHAAGVLDNRMLRDLDEESLRRVLAPKAEGAWVLHELFPPGTVDFLALFSSCGMLLGLTGQASYASGNAFLDALAAHRRAAGHDDTVSFGWTSWRGLGMSTSSAVIDAELTARGTGDITATEAFRCWEFAARCGGGYFAVLRTVPLDPGTPRLPLLSELAVPDQQPDGVAAQTAAWRHLPPEELRGYLVEEVSRQVAAETKRPASEVDIRRPLPEMGLDSVMTVIIRRRLEKHFRLSLPATLLWNHPTVAAIADYLAECLDRQAAAPAADPAPPAADRAQAAELVAG